MGFGINAGFVVSSSFCLFSWRRGGLGRLEGKKDSRRTNSTVILGISQCDGIPTRLGSFGGEKYISSYKPAFFLGVLCAFQPGSVAAPARYRQKGQAGQADQAAGGHKERGMSKPHRNTSFALSSLEQHARPTSTMHFDVKKSPPLFPLPTILLQHSQRSVSSIQPPPPDKECV
jgi:hypothetical protein